MRPQVVLVTGSRDWSDRQAIFSCLSVHPDRSILIHGGCRGADSIAAAVAKQLAFKIWELPFFLGEDGREARNESMIAVACALRDKGHRVTSYAWPMEGSVGTLKCMRLMREAGLHIANWENQG